MPRICSNVRNPAANLNLHFEGVFAVRIASLRLFDVQALQPRADFGFSLRDRGLLNNTFAHRHA